MKKLISAIALTAMLSSVILPVYADEQWKSGGKVTNDAIGLQMMEQAKKDMAQIDLNIYINGKQLNFEEEENLGMPFIDENNRTLVPLRKPVEMSGNKVEWDNVNKQAKITSKGNDEQGELYVTVKLGEKYLTKVYSKMLNSPQLVEMDTKAVVKDARIYIPLRAVMEALGLRVSYNKDTKTVSANYPSTKATKVWSGVEEIEKDFPNFIQDMKKIATKAPDTVVIDTIKLDNSLGEKMENTKGEKGGKWIDFVNEERYGMVFIKDGKVVYRTDDFLPNIFYYRFPDDSLSNEKYAYKGDIKDVDYFLLWEYNNPMATIVENPFK